MLVLSETIVKYLYTVYVYCGNKCFKMQQSPIGGKGSAVLVDMKRRHAPQGDVEDEVEGGGGGHERSELVLNVINSVGQLGVGQGVAPAPRGGMGRHP